MGVQVKNTTRSNLDHDERLWQRAYESRREANSAVVSKLSPNHLRQAHFGQSKMSGRRAQFLDQVGNVLVHLLTVTLLLTW